MSFLSSDMDKINKAIDKGDGQFEAFVTAILYLMKKYTPETGGTQYYDRLADAADGGHGQASLSVLAVWIATYVSFVASDVPEDAALSCAG